MHPQILVKIVRTSLIHFHVECVTEIFAARAFFYRMQHNTAKPKDDDDDDISNPSSQAKRLSLSPTTFHYSSTCTTGITTINKKEFLRMTSPLSTMKMLETAIVDLECRLGLQPGESKGNQNQQQPQKKPKKKAQPPKKNNNNNKQPAGPSPEELAAQPEICKLEFKVGVITKVWEHPMADKLYCEEIDVGEESPRQIASGLRPHFTLEEMMGQRLLVVSNLKAKNLVKFKSHGMVLCAAQSKEDGSETVEFVEPPEDAKPGEVVRFEGLAKPMPLAASQVEKKKVFRKCLEGLTTDEGGIATWNGHKFMVGDSYCKAKTICNGPMR